MIKMTHASPEISVPRVIALNAGMRWVKKLTSICSEITVRGPVTRINSVSVFGLEMTVTKFFAMFFAILLLFKEPRRSDEAQTVNLAQAAKNFVTVISNPRFMIFLLIFSGYWIVYWQEFIILPLYIHDYINPKTDTELILVTGPLTVISLQMLVSFLTH